METRKVRVLCVDDDLSVARMLAEVVQFCGYDGVIEMSAVEAASTHVADVRVRALLCDYMMPGLDGLDVLTVWQERRPEVRRVLVTAAPNETAVREAVRTGLVQMVVSKPPTIGDIKMALAWLTSA